MPPAIPNSRQVPFLEDGWRRARAAAEAEIRAEVLAEFAERLRPAGWLERLRLRRQIKREIERRLEKIAPRHGQYLAP
ncbi:MAG TPA: hypothetical protein VL175_14445 [Pirellulales bacterium]|nr:hypothetical protein [Pirellulales bacterium]